MFGRIVGKLIRHGVQTVVHSPRLVGVVGEKRVQWELSRLPYEYRVLSDLLLPRSNGQTSQIDHVVVSQYGVFMVEVKNYHGSVTGRGNEKYWLHQVGSEQHRFYNPIWQNHGHIRALQEIIGDEEPSIYVNLVVFGNGAQLDVRSREWVGHVDELLSVIERYQTVRLSEDQVEQIVERLKQENVWDGREGHEHVRRIKRYEET